MLHFSALRDLFSESSDEPDWQLLADLIPKSSAKLSQLNWAWYL